MKEKKIEYTNELNTLKSEQNFYEIELEKLTQFWTITRQQLASEQERSIKLETCIQRLKTTHVEQISVCFIA